MNISESGAVYTLLNLLLRPAPTVARPGPSLRRMLLQPRASWPTVPVRSWGCRA